MRAETFYRGRRVVVTGGAGFIGSNLVHRLAELGAQIHVVDALVPQTGANRFNLDRLANRITLHERNISDAAGALDGVEVVFNLAGQGNHLLSMSDPSLDLALNCSDQLKFLEAARRLARAPRIVLASTRQVYGAHERLPIDELHPTRPCDLNGIHKLTCESYHSMYSDLHGLEATILRLSNVYGPRMSMRPCVGAPVMSRFIGTAIDAGHLEIFGDGTQLRDPLYVDDAVDAFLAAGQLEKGAGVLNIAGDERVSVGAIAAAVAKAAGNGARSSIIPFPRKRQDVDIGSSFLDCSKAQRLLGWKPQTGLEAGLLRTVAYCREYRSRYW